MKFLNFWFLLSSHHDLKTLFTKTNSWLIYESVKALEITASMLFKLVFAKTTILSCFFFLNYWLILF